MKIEKYFLICLALSVSIFTGQSVLAVEYSYSTIDYPGATDTWVYGINDAGDIVGHYYDVVWGGSSYVIGQHGFSRIGNNRDLCHGYQ